MKNGLILSVFLLIISSILFPYYSFAQESEVVNQNQYEEYYKKPTYIPDVRFHGNYQFYSLSYQDATTNTTSTWQDFELKLNTELHTKVSLFLSLTNTPYEWGYNTRNSYNIYDNSLRIKNPSTDLPPPSNENINIKVKKIYLEYKFNPLSTLRIGRQKVQLGDKLGLIYPGEIDAISFSCRLGTWCLKFGQGNLTTKTNRATWIQFFYPIYESAETINNYWVKNQQRKKRTLKIDFYRIDDKQNNLALATHGGRTYGPSTVNKEKYYATDHLQHNGQYVFYDRIANIYGINLDWFQNNFSLHFYTIQSLGKRNYYYEDNTLISEQKNNLFGRVYRLEWRQLFGSSSQIGWISQSTSGKEEQKNVEKNLPWFNDSTYYEWNRGSYEGSLIYFGSNYKGQEHSISNILLNSFYYKFYDEKTDINTSLEIYQFSRTKKVLNNIGKLVSNIGIEIDFIFSKEIAENFYFQLDGGYFLVGDAYSPRATDMPSNIYENITQYSIGIQYKF